MVSNQDYNHLLKLPITFFLTFLLSPPSHVQHTILLSKSIYLVVYAYVYGCCSTLDSITVHDLALSWLYAIPLIMHTRLSAPSHTSSVLQWAFMCSASYATEGASTYVFLNSELFKLTAIL